MGWAMTTALRVGQVMTWNGSLWVNADNHEGGVDVRLYGATEGGLVDSTEEIVAAIAAGIAAGQPTVGGGKTYGVSGNITLPANAWLQDITLRQLTPGAGTVRTLTSAGGDNIRLVRVTVDRNGDGTAGTHQVDAGVYIDGGSNHYFENVEVFGDDIGGGFVLKDASDSDLFRVHVHDMHFIYPGASNDQMNGIWITGCTRIRLINCLSHDLSGDIGAGPTRRFTRGFTYSGSTGVQILGCRTWYVDQGNDTTGSVGNSRFLFDGCYAGYCMTVGFKFSNTARDGQVGNCIAERVGLWGFVVNGPTGSGMTDLASSDIQFTDCVAYDTGYADHLGGTVAGSKIGFRAQNGSFDLDTTLGIRFIGCKAIDRQDVRTMANGFDNDVAANTDGKYNEAIDCVSVGHLGVAFNGMHSARCEVSRVAVQSIGNNAWEVVHWTADDDKGAMHDVASSNESVFARREGVYRSTWGAVFAFSGVGQRGVRILRNGAVIPGTTVIVDTSGSGETAIQTSWSSTMGTGDNLRVEVFQDSGGALDLQITSGGVVEQIG